MSVPAKQPIVYVEAPQPAPVIVVHQESPRFRQSRSWFVPSFTGTLGFVLAWMAVPAFLLLMAAGGLLLLTSQRVADHAELAASARRMATAPLRQVGILEVSADSTVERSGNRVVFAATGRDRYAELHPVSVHFYVAQFGKTEQWKCEYVTVDGRVVE